MPHTVGEHAWISHESSMQNITLEVRKSKDRNLVSIKYKIKVAHSLEEGHSRKSKANPYILGVDMEIGRNRNRQQE